jgi:Rrf2 family protein
MNFSVKTEYAMQAVLDLALQPPDEPVKIADIASRQKIPRKFLELILASLKQGGFVESRRGAEGGYILARPPGEITVGAVLHFVEGNKKTRKEVTTPFSNLWRQVDDAVEEILEHTTFADMVREWKAAQADYIASWEI